MVFKFINNKFKGFSLVQIMMILFAIAVIMAASMPLITRKYKAVPRPALHGKWACMQDEDGNLIQAGARNGSSSLPAPGSSSWKPGCDFPVLPEKVDYLLVQVIGGGAAGEAASVTRKPYGETQILSDTDILIDADGLYRITLTGETGGSPNLLQTGGSTYSYFVGTADRTIVVLDCPTYFYQSAKPGRNVSLVYEQNLKAGDTFRLIRYDDLRPVNSLDPSINTCHTTCPPGTQAPSAPGKCFVSVYGSTFNPSGWTSSPTITLSSFKRPSGVSSVRNGRNTVLIHNEEEVAEIAGSLTGRWTSNTYESGMAFCTVSACERYVAVASADITGANPLSLIKRWPAAIPAINRCENGTAGCVDGAGEVGKNASGNPLSNSIMLVNPVNIYQGGCGGAAGEAITILMQTASGASLDINSLVIGAGGIPGVDNGRGGPTSFAGITAKGGTNCALGSTFNTNSPPWRSSDGGFGGNGGSAPTSAPSDSRGGNGASFNGNTQVSAQDGMGIGAGGGGGAAKFTDIEEFVSPGSGLAGGIIVSW